jgi:hypothetical protein
VDLHDSLLLAYRLGELERFAPHLNVLKYHGSAKERAEIRADYDAMEEHVSHAPLPLPIR